MRTRSNPRRAGLVLLIVLGMLALLSLLAVTFLVFSSQARNASTALIKRDFRETPHDKLLDEAFRQILRGTQDTHSVAFKNDILGDLYGSARFVAGGTVPTDLPLSLTARIQDTSNTVLRDNPKRLLNENYVVPSAMSTFDPTSPEAPKTYPVNTSPGQFLKIPLSWRTVSFGIQNYPLPEQWDALTGRVVTFVQGPLVGKSYRIVRYIGEVDAVDVSGTLTLDPQRADLQYTITIDMSETMDDVVSVRNPATGVVESKPISSWLAMSPAVLLYGTPASLSDPFIMQLNAGTHNSNGIGLDLAGAVTTASTANGAFTNVPDSLLANRAKSAMFNSSYSPTGDTDEPWDAPDSQNMYLAHKQEAVSSSSGSDDVIPSFHRPAVINYLISLAPDLSTINTGDPNEVARFVDFLELVERASGRPISYNIRGLVIGGVAIKKNADFSGSNGLSTSFGGGLRNPQLVIDWSKLPNAQEESNFQAWLRWQTRGPWDVDNDGDGVNDSVWADLNFPLITSPEGKLLKALVSFYIEDMDGRVDINASGDVSQNTDTTAPNGALVINTSKYGHYNSASGTGHWPQGLGVGAAEISPRPILQSGEFATLLSERYKSPDSTDTGAGANGNDKISELLERNRPDYPSTYTSPPTRNGFPASPLPMAIQGKSGLGLDLLGNPILVESGTISETTDDPYEARLLFHSRSDRPFSIGEYQRVARLNDLDRASLPRRLQAATSSTFNTLTGMANYFENLRSISPRNVTLTTPAFPLEYDYPRYSDASGVTVSVKHRVTSFIQFVEAFAQNKTPQLRNPVPPIYFPRSALPRLFPVEFMQNRPLDLNRPWGNGLDDDNDAIVDEADEAATTASYPNTTPPPSAAIPMEEYVRDASGFAFNFDPALEGQNATIRSRYDGNQAKQMFARHLYCLAQLILPANHRFSNHPTAGTAAPTQPERARILAQWAVNVVDFRDQDAACTRFAYDSDPFTPKASGIYWQPGNSVDDGVVWGLEQPELLITESFAVHNSNIRKIPNPDPAPAPQHDQLRVPEGSLFLEFFVPRTTSNVNNNDSSLPPATGSLYTLDGSVPKLNLNQTVANPDDAANPFPVWRVLFLKPQAEASGGGYKDAFTQVYEDSNPKTRFYYTYQVGNDPNSGLRWLPLNESSIPNIPEPRIDRVMWFANIDPASSNHALPSMVANGVVDPENYIFRFTDGDNVVSGGQFLVVGPRPITYMGSKQQTGVYNKKPSNHRFQLAGDWLQVWNQNNEPALWASTTNPPLVANNTPAPTANNAVFSDRIRECVTMSAGMRVPDVTTNNWLSDSDIKYKWIGLNVSEPVRSRYYPLPGHFLNSNDTGVDTDTNAPGYKHTTASKDAYIDLYTNTGTPPQSLDLKATGYLKENNWSGTEYPDVKTETNWSAAVLQRLADPTRAWHAVFNPYITVDWMSIDLTVFSGEADLPNSGPIQLASREKTGQAMLPGQTPTSPGLLQGVTLYSYHTAFQSTPSTKTGDASNPYFDYEVNAEQYTSPSGTPKPRSPNATFSTFGYLNPRYVIRGTGALQTPAVPAATDFQFTDYFKGVPGPNLWASSDPSQPLHLPLAPYFPNRDFVNAYELTSVPLSAPGQFMQEFAYNGAGAGPKFAHTLDFEDTLLPNVNPPTKPAAGNAKSTALLFECVGVRSPWADSWRVAHPVSTRGYSAGSQQETAQTHLLEPYRAPFNQLPTFREPGRINLNTIAEPKAFRGLMWNIMTPTDTSARNSNTVPYKANIVGSRQGYNTLTGPMPTRTISDPNPHLDARSPTEFLKVFASPLTPYNFPLAIQQSSTSASMSIFRQLPTGASRLFNASESGVFPGTNTGIFNTFTYNYPVSRMANLVTNRSNVFAIRMTLGFFEVDVSGQIGREYGAEQGRSKRHRAFYMIDRSIPVAYQMGDDFNAEDCVLARTIIE